MTALLRINALDINGKPIGIEIEGEKIKSVQPSHFDAPTLDLKDQVVLPQIIDAHNHPAPYNLGYAEKLLGDKQGSMGTFKSRADWNGLWRATSDDIMKKLEALLGTTPESKTEGYCDVYQYASLRDMGAAVIQGFDPLYFKACVPAGGVALSALKPKAAENIWLFKPDDMAKDKILKRSREARETVQGDPMVVHLAEGFPGEPSITLEVTAAYYAGVLSDEKKGGVFIHGIGFSDADLNLIKNNKGGIIWSPVSQQNLYSSSFDVRRALERGLMIGLGADWALSGSPNILREMAEAQKTLETRFHYHPTEAASLVLQMATTNNATLLGLEEYAGVKPGMIASLTFVPRGTVLPKGILDLKTLDETDVSLSLQRGHAAFGDTPIMRQLDPKAEELVLSEACQAKHVSKAVANLPEGMTYKAVLEKLNAAFGSVPELVKCE